MDFRNNDISWRCYFEETVLKKIKRVYFIYILLCILSFIVIGIDKAVLRDQGILYSVGSIFAQVITSIIFLYIGFKIENKKYGDYYFSVFVVAMDIIGCVVSFAESSDETAYSRQLYRFIFFSVIMLNIKLDLTLPLYFICFAVKLCLLAGILSIYDFKKNYKYNVFLDFTIILYMIVFIPFHRFFKDSIFSSLESLYNKSKLSDYRVTNILSTIKSPILSINFGEKSIFYNNMFNSFIKENFDEQEFGTRFLFNENSEDEVTEIYFKTLVEILTTKEKEYFDKMIKSRDDVNEKRLLSFKIKVLVLNKIFSSFMNEGLISFGIIENLNFFNLIQDKRIFKEDEYFEQLGEFKVQTPKDEFVYELSWKKTITKERYEALDIILNDITSVKNSQFLKADVKFRKVYLAKIVQEFISPVRSLTQNINKLSTKVEEMKKDNSNTEITEMSQNVEYLEGHSHYLNILFYNINDYCKDINDFDVNLDVVDIREVVKFSFKILECLVSKDEEKSNNIKLEINIDEKIPAVITSDERRIKQILVNLISNSVKFTQSGTIKLNVEPITKEGNNDIEAIKISVEDTGIGITKEDQIRLFSVNTNNNRGFFNSENSGGLGLSICKKIIQKLGKDLQCESGNDKTKVSFTLFDYSLGVAYPPTVGFDTKPALNNTTNDEDYSKLLKNEIIEKTIDKNLLDDSASIILKKNTQVELEFKKENIKGKSSNRSKIEVIVSGKREVPLRMKKVENFLISLIQNQSYNDLKSSFLNFNKPLITYINFIANYPVDYKCILIVDDEENNLDYLKSNIKGYFNDKGIKNTKIIKLSDAMDALNILYFDSMYFSKVYLVITDLEMKYLNGDKFFKVVKFINNKSFQNIRTVLYSNTEIGTSTLREEGITNILKKPCSRNELEKILNQFDFNSNQNS